jgi:thioredoxin-dependent peroxiredoxin
MLNEKDVAPDFELTADDSSAVRLSDLRGRKVVLFFYPRADTPGCTVEACEFADRSPGFDSRGAAVYGISPDSVADVRAFREKFDLPYRLLADEDHAVAERYGVWKEKTMFGNTYMGVERSTFVIDEEGRIERVYARVKPEGHAARVLADLAAQA